MSRYCEIVGRVRNVVWINSQTRRNGFANGRTEQQHLQIVRNSLAKSSGD